MRGYPKRKARLHLNWSGMEKPANRNGTPYELITILLYDASVRLGLNEDNKQYNAHACALHSHRSIAIGCVCACALRVCNSVHIHTATATRRVDAFVCRWPMVVTNQTTCVRPRITRKHRRHADVFWFHFPILVGTVTLSLEILSRYEMWRRIWFPLVDVRNQPDNMCSPTFHHAHDNRQCAYMRQHTAGSDVEAPGLLCHATVISHDEMFRICNWTTSIYPFSLLLVILIIGELLLLHKWPIRNWNYCIRSLIAAPEWRSVYHWTYAAHCTCICFSLNCTKANKPNLHIVWTQKSTQNR